VRRELQGFDDADAHGHADQQHRKDFCDDCRAPSRDSRHSCAAGEIFTTQTPSVQECMLRVHDGARSLMSYKFALVSFDPFCGGLRAFLSDAGLFLQHTENAALATVRAVKRS